MKSIENIKVGYFCSFVPFNYFSQLGFKMIAIPDILTEIVQYNPDLPIDLCSMARINLSIIEHLDLDGIILTNCCNSMQKLFEYIQVKMPQIAVWIIEIPKDKTEDQFEWFRKNIYKLENDMMLRFSIKDRPIHDNLEPGQHTLTSPLEDGNTILVLGNNISDKFRNAVRNIMKEYTIKIISCTDRTQGDHIMWGALEDRNLPCICAPSYIMQFRQYLHKYRNRISGMIFATSQHCDQTQFSVPVMGRIAKDEFDIPVMSMHIENNQRVTGQILTRLEAFYERMVNQQTIGIYHKVYANHSLLMGQKNHNNSLFLQKINEIKRIIPVIPLKSVQLLLEHQLEMFRSVADSPEKVVWTNMVMPTEIFYSMGLIPLNIELISGWLATLGLSRQYIMDSEGLGIGTQLCSYHKAALGLMLNDLSFRPRTMVLSSTICDGGRALASFCENTFGTKVKIINIPFNNHHSNLPIVEKEVKNAWIWLSKNTGRSQDYESLINSVNLSNHSRAKWVEANRIRAESSGFPGKYVLRNLFGATFLFGSVAGDRIISQYYRDVKNITVEGTKRSSKKRILWVHFAPLHRNSLMDFLENELNCEIVADAVSYMYWQPYDKDNVFHSMALRLMSHFYNGQVENRKNIYRKIITDARVDGIVHFMHSCCRSIVGASWLLRDLSHELKKPYLELSGDCIDPRGYSDAQSRLRLQAFSEAMDGALYVYGN